MRCPGGWLDIDDVTYLLRYIFNSGQVPEPMGAADVNAVCTIDVDDVVHIVEYMFGDGEHLHTGCPTGEL